MKRFALLTLTVTILSLGGGQVAHADVVAGCSVTVPAQQPAPLGIGSGGYRNCFDYFYVPADGSYAFSLDSAHFERWFLGVRVSMPGTGKFQARLYGPLGVITIGGRFISGVLVEGVASWTGDLAAGWWTLGVDYTDAPLIDRCVGEVHSCLHIRYYAGFGGATGSVTTA